MSARRLEIISALLELRGGAQSRDQGVVACNANQLGKLLEAAIGELKEGFSFVNDADRCPVCEHANAHNGGPGYMCTHSWCRCTGAAPPP